MRLILSRKGFDSSAGGCPSPILPDGRLLNLPIPDGLSTIAYRDVRFDQQPLSKWVNNLTGRPRMAAQCAHLDPDIRSDALPSRHQNWRGVLGQHGSAQTHLKNESVTAGDLFLFFGLFRPIEMHKRRWRFVPGAPARHVIWGWLQIAEIVAVDECDDERHAWTEYHPHRRYASDTSNQFYLAETTLKLPALPSALPGYGTLDRLTPANTLSDPDSHRPSDWRLPLPFKPTSEEPALSYHRNLNRWRSDNHACYLNAAARGQEFVLGPGATERSNDWILTLFNENTVLHDQVD